MLVLAAPVDVAVLQYWLEPSLAREDREQGVDARGVSGTCGSPVRGKDVEGRLDWLGHRRICTGQLCSLEFC